MKDMIVQSVIDQLQERSEIGIKKYGITVDKNPLSLVEWAEHAIQESLDKALYLRKFQKDVSDINLELELLKKAYPEEKTIQATINRVLSKINSLNEYHTRHE